MRQHTFVVFFIHFLFCYFFMTASEENINHELVEQSTNIDLKWLGAALRDVIYYLRAYKFNEYDRRYHTNSNSPGKYFARNPKPPLRSLHWEVKVHCEDLFLNCIEYLNNRVKHTELRRKDDTSVIIHEQEWYGRNFSKQIDTVEMECKQLRKRDDSLAKPFEGPLERFQWRTTASYYLCWYVMNEVQYLESIGEPCDNFATCLDSEFGASNKDPRASDNSSFGCVLYSVCPDPCCPLRHISSFDECWNNQMNPCFQNNPDGHRKCDFERNRNTDFRDMVLNRWNVTCECPEPGYIWESRYGTCVDVNECATAVHNCDDEREVCVNVAGSYRCVCNWGYVWNKEQAKCESSPALDTIKQHRQQKTLVHSNEPFSIKVLIKKLLYKSAGQRVHYSPMWDSGRIAAWIVTVAVAVIIRWYFLNITC